MLNPLKIASIALIVIVIISLCFFVAKNEENVHKIYEVARPHYGPLVKLKEVELQYIGNIANSFLSTDESKSISVGQKVVLYNGEEETLPLGAKVIAVKPDEKQTKIIISLPFGTKTDLLNEKANIITYEEIAAKRLPLSALQRGEDGSLYVWRVGKKEDQSHLQENSEPSDVSFEKILIKDITENEDYFVEPSSLIKPMDFIVLNPDDKLDNDKNYQAQIEEFKAPLHNPIKQAWVDLELKKLADQREKDKQAYLDCIARNAPKLQGGEMSNADGASSSSSCGSSFNPNNPFEIFQNLLDHPHPH